MGKLNFKPLAWSQGILVIQDDDDDEEQTWTHGQHSGGGHSLVCESGRGIIANANANWVMATNDQPTT